MIKVPQCPDELPETLVAQLRTIATEWAQSSLRPAPSKCALKKWGDLIDAWIESDLPLYVRRFNDSFTRGAMVEHHSGRKLVPVDNTPAHWAFSMAYSGSVPTSSELEHLITEDEVPIAMMLKKRESEATRFKCIGRKFLLNKHGWKVCHRTPVNLGRGDITKMPLETIEKHFRKFMSPSNIFLVPLALSGLGEIRDFIKAMDTTT